MAETTRDVMIAHQPFTLRSSQIEGAMRGVLPEPVKDHFVVVNGRRYPPKQVLLQVTGLERAELTTHHARRILTGLGFPAGRRAREREALAGTGTARRRALPSEQGASTSRTGSCRRAVQSRASAATLEPFVGHWVATKGDEVLVAALQPRAVVGWLAQHNQQADSMFRVPDDEHEASGAAPL